MDPITPESSQMPPGIPPSPAGGAAMGPANPATPMEAPMNSPQKPVGDEAMADVNVKMALDVLTNTLPVYGATSEKGRALMDVLKKLSSAFGVQASKHAEAVPAEVAALMASLRGNPGQPPAQPIAGGPALPVPPAPGA